jgi:hypothetical protein
MDRSWMALRIRDCWIEKWLNGQEREPLLLATSPLWCEAFLKNSSK